MPMSRCATCIVGIATVLSLGIAGSSLAVQQARMQQYENELQERIPEKLETFRVALLQWKRDRIEAKAGQDSDADAIPTEEDRDVPDAIRYVSARSVDELTLEELGQSFVSTVSLYESGSREGQDVEIRLTMPIEAFMEFAPVAALEAASIPHKFPVATIFVREETSDRVGRVSFRDAEPIAARYAAGDEDAIEDMKDALIWH